MWCVWCGCCWPHWVLLAPVDGVAFLGRGASKGLVGQAMPQHNSFSQAAGGGSQPTCQPRLPAQQRLQQPTAQHHIGGGLISPPALTACGRVLSTAWMCCCCCCCRFAIASESTRQRLASYDYGPSSVTPHFRCVCVYVCCWVVAAADSSQSPHLPTMCSPHCA